MRPTRHLDIHSKTGKKSQVAYMVFTFLSGVLLLSFQDDTRLIREVYAQDNPVDLSGFVNRDDPVDLVADSLENDEATQTVTAKGNVELVQAGRILKADQVSYNLQTDTVQALGNVVLNELNGDTYFADEIELSDQLKSGFGRGLQALLADGSRFTAQEGERVAGTKIIMRDATYTPCEPCEDNPDAPPDWQLLADKVTHDDAENRIIYNDARLEMWGVPVAWVPYFSHPDGSVKQKSGFLTPSVGFDSELGAIYQQEYYWALAPDKDATFGAFLSSDEAPLILGSYRQRFRDAEFDIAGGITYSDRTDRENGIDVVQDEEWRGHVFANGLWNIDNKWRAGLDLNLVSDDQYMRQYDFTDDDILENEAYVERFSGRNYSAFRLLGFQDIRISERQAEQPAILPEVEVGFIGEPNKTLGGRWSAKASATNLMREGNDQDVSRGSLELGWQRRLVNKAGLVTTLDLNGRSDAYHVRDRDIAIQGSGRNSDSTEVRTFAQAHIENSYPLVNQIGQTQIVLEPKVAFTAGANIDVNDDIPDEDSQDTVLDATNLFEPNRFSGYDRIEDRSRVTYGLQTGIHHVNGNRGEVFLGQSYRFDNNDNPFLDGSGLSQDDSDYVGRISAVIQNSLNLDYRFQLENTNFSAQRHELDATTSFGPLTLNTRYFFAKGLEGTDIIEDREQVTGWASYKIDDEWSINGSARYDLGEDPGLRRATYGLLYSGQCITAGITGERTLTTDASGDSGTDIIFRVGLKNLGEFETSGFTLGGDDD